MINIVPGGRDTGAYLVSHPDIDKVSFTGSTSAGRQVAAACAELLRPVTLELGGKSAAVVLDDADLTATAEQFFMASLLNNGQTCYASTRILAPRSRYREVVGFCTAMARDAVVGDALDPGTQIGPARQPASARTGAGLPGFLQKAPAFTEGVNASQDCSDVHVRADVFAARCTGGRSPTVLRRTMRRSMRGTTGARA
ncbi:aldehyde dehydrogenase family protein [Streptomyces sp. NPDC001796]|uniref:aldehyde dehydrogenase family protein n=1 Tax=Streptomyces sp. NPDC001796 TaxID=3364609 RepID=UPI0036A35393